MTEIWAVYTMLQAVGVDPVNIAGWAFTLGSTFSYMKVKLDSIEKRVERIERWVDDN